MAPRYVLPGSRGASLGLEPPPDLPDLSPRPFHGLRHIYGTLALEAGVPIEVISKRLGHASIAITADIYQHVRPGVDRDAAEAVAGLILRTRPS